MTPDARWAAAAEILDIYLAGEPAEKALTNWARRSRFAGSKDRAAVRDHVFDAIRRRRSAAALGGAETGRGLVIGSLRAAGVDPADHLTGQGHALTPLSEMERQAGNAPDGTARLDCPEWLAPALRASLGSDFEPVMLRLQSRAELFLRVNKARTGQAEAVVALASDGVTCAPHPLCETALVVRDGARRVRQSAAYLQGLVEIQDVASQALTAAVPLDGAPRVLDYCAGGGGKALALAARGVAEVFVHDALPDRMADLPDRARRAGARLTVLRGEAVASRAPFDLVVCDVPCSGSGAWRRQPEAKWRLSAEDLHRLEGVQREILATAAGLVGAGGHIAYMTCSLLASENEDQAAWFLARFSGWQQTQVKRLSPLDGGDGFFLSVLRNGG